MSANSSQPVSNGRAVAGLVVFLITVGSVIYGCSTSDSDSGTTDTGSDQSGMAEVMCEDFVNDQLEAPSTADFPGASSVENIKLDTYRVTASVDSENGFGAKIRTGYVCTVIDVGNDKWNLISLNFDN
jgi:hypothetical protein